MAKDSRGLGSSLLAGVLALCVTIMAVPAHAAVGRTAGSLNVNNVGGASYTIPIFAPPGPGGLQPSIALVYSSNGGRGIVGRGWSLAGFSSIHSCAPNDALDGYMGPVRHDGLYCLNGNRLRMQSGAYYGAAGSVYMTEMADFSRATFNGMSGTPPSWKVEGKDGLIYTYGGTDDSRVASSSTLVEWKLSELRDRSGNKVRFTYADGHPSSIEWTQTSHNSGSYVNSMEFSYEPDGNAAASTHVGSVEGVEVTHDADLLTAITVKVSETAKRKYLLEYEDSPTTGAKRLETVTECDGAGTDCLAPTAFTYQDGAWGTEGTPATNVPYYTADASGDYDFNGDGIRDIAFVVYSVCYVRLGSASGTPYSQEYMIGNAQSVMAGKLLGNSKDQLVALPASSTTFHVYDWDEENSEFTATSTGIALSATSGNITVADLDGDDLDDLAYIAGWDIDYVGTDYSATPHVQIPQVDIVMRRNTTADETLSFASAVTTQWTWPTMTVLPPWWPGIDMEYHFFIGNLGFYAVPDQARLTNGGDLDGDGIQELNLGIELSVGEYPYGGAIWDGWEITHGWSDFIVRFSGGGDAEVSKLNEGGTWLDGKLTSADFNQDGCDDYAAYYEGYYTGFSSCNWRAINIESDGLIANGYRAESGPFEGAVDLDGDGRVEYLTGFGDVVIRTDGNGDGLDDMGVFVSGTSFAIYNHASSLVPDRLSQVEDGFGVTQTLEYASIARSNYTPGSSDTFPYRQLNDPLHVVSKVTSSDGIGSTYDTTYHYTGAMTSLARRSLVGFEKIESEDLRSHIKHERQFEMTEPYMGMLKAEKFYQPSGAGSHVISEKAMTFATHTLDATANNQRRFPYVWKIDEKVYEVGGDSNADLITETSVENTYDTSGNLTASTSTVTDKDSSSPNYLQSWTTAMSTTITPNTTDWCLGLPASISVTRSTSVSGESSVPKEKTFTHDTDSEKCRISTESVGSGNLKVTTGYEYDNFGNVKKVAVTGRNLTDTEDLDQRVSETTFGSADGTPGGTGQFPVSVKNPLNQTSTRTFDATFGGLLTEYDPNSIRVAYKEYDNFGRLTLDKQADDTSTLYSYEACDSNCKSDEDRMLVTASERNTSGSEFRNSRMHVDMLGRSWLSDVQNFSGGYTRQWSQFDNQGRVAYQGIPCDASSCTPAWPTNTNVVTNDYDLLGRLTSQSRPENDVSSTPVETHFAYAGRTQTILDPNSKATTKVLDVNGWMRQSRDDEGYGQNFSYDAAGSLLEVTDTLSNTLFTAEYAYGIQPFQYDTIDTDLGHWEYTYNSLGELVHWKDANENEFYQAYDLLSRVTSRTDGDESVTTEWDWGTSDSGHNIGRLEGVSMPGYSEALSYDSKGRLSTRSITIGINTYDIDYDYTNKGLLDTLTYPTSTSSTRVKVKYGDNTYGFLQNVKDWTSGEGTAYWTANTQNVRGQTIEETLGNDVVTSRNFDGVTGWLNSIQSVKGTTSLQNLTYGYDAMGNVTQRQAIINLTDLTENFYYDDLYRLTSYQLGSNSAVTLEYDDMGNISSRTGVGSYDYETEQSGCDYYAHSQGHAVRSAGSTAYCYDANGNMTKRGGHSIVWKSYNYPESLADGTETATFSYGPDRQYYKQDYTGPGVSETTYYIGGLLEKVDNGSTIDWRHYIAAEGQTVAIVSRKSGASSANTVNYPLEDNQGSGLTLTDGSGGLLVRQSYEPFGKQRDGDDWEGAESSGDLTTMEGITRRGYTGHSMLGRMELIHMNGRVQDARIGRFLSPDPYVTQPGFTQGYNRYAYVNNNPASYIDPSGFATYRYCRTEAEREIEYDFYYAELGNGRGLYRPTGTYGYRLTGGSTQVCFNLTVPDEVEVNPDSGFTKVASKPKEKPKLTLPKPQGDEPDWHYDRNRSNAPPGTLKEALAQKWEILPYDKSLFHHFGDWGWENTKVISPDGHMEGVYDARGILVTDPRNMGTYNYYSPIDHPWDHFLIDVIPYVFRGNSPNDPTPFTDRVMGR